MVKTMVTFIVLLALLLVIPWAIYAGHGHDGNTSDFVRGSSGHPMSFVGGWMKVFPETVPPNR